MSLARLALLLRPDRRRAVPIMTHPGIDRIGKRVIDCVTDGEAQLAAILELARAYPTAAATSVMDLTLEAEAFGAQIVFADHEIPTVRGSLVSDLAAVQALRVPAPTACRLGMVQRVARQAAAAISDRPLLAGCIGPFSLAGRLFGMTEIMTACLLEPETIHLLLEHARLLKAAGANGLIMAEPAAGLLSAEQCDELSSAYVRRVVEAVQDPGFLFVLHNCGNRGQVTASMVSTGARGLHFGNQADLLEALHQVPAERLVMGNLDPAGLLKMSTAAAVKAAAAGLLRATAGHPNFILSSGCDTPPGVPEANIAAMFDAVAEANQAAGRA